MKKALVIAALVVPVAYLASFLYLFSTAAKTTTPSDAILGALAGALGAVVVAPLTVLIAIWSKNQESKTELRKSVSAHAIEITRMDYELRIRALESSGVSQRFLAPSKVYREIYRAILDLQEKDEWPKTVEELGLLNVFELDATAPFKREHRMKCLAALREFVDGPMQTLDKFLHGGNTMTEAEREESLQPVTKWIDTYRTIMPRNVEGALVRLERIAYAAVSNIGMDRLQSFRAKAFEEDMKTVSDHYGKLRAEFEGDT